jgi:hypothetical protein
MTHEPHSVGQAKTVLVFGAGEEATAVISTIRARTTHGNTQVPLRFAGPVAFDAQTIEHARTVLLPLVEEVLTALGVPTPSFEVSVANIGAASSQDIGVRVTGFSADAPIFLAMLSCALGMPAPGDIVSTGHIGSAAGEVRMVKSLREKLGAASADPTIKLLLHPSLDKDMSLDRLAPLKLDQGRSAVAAARKHCRVSAVGDVADLLRAVFREEDVVASALRNDYFQIEGQRQPCGSALERAVGFLCSDMERRFWICLEQGLMGGDNAVVSGLIRERLRFHVRMNAYPAGVGARLYRALSSLPPLTLRRKTKFPLVAAGDALVAGALAKPVDFDDVRKLYAAISGEVPRRGNRVPQGPQAREVPDDIAAALDYVLCEIAPDVLAKQVGLPIDEARACYVMDSATVEDERQFLDAIAAFQMHLMSHVRGLEKPAAQEDAGSEALALLERTFAGKGGTAGATVEGIDGTHGGMRTVLDAMTAQFKKECQEKHVAAVLKEAIGTKDWGRRAKFMAALLTRLEPNLAPDIDASQPERYVHQCEFVVCEYVASFERVNQILQAL